jgi:hypothetical protein
MSKAADLAALIGSQSPQSHRNILINGAMQIAQRGTSGTFAHDGTTDGYLSVDRYTMALGGTHEQLDGTMAQVADHPLSANGKSLKWTTGTAESSYDADEYAYVTQIIEAQHLQHINNGNSNAVPLTLSFYVKSSVTGTFAVGFYKEDTTARIFNKTYAISSANTWEKKTLTFAGDTGGGGIVNDNGRGFYLVWHIAAGSNVVGGGSTSGWQNYGGLSDWADGQATNAVATTASATWQITNCQLEIGETATPFEHRSFADELHRCQRYYAVRENATGGTIYYGNTLQAYGTSSIYGVIADYPVTMRATPTVSQSGTFGAYTATSGNNSMNSTIGNLSATSHAWRTGGWSGTSNLTAGHASVLFANNGAKLMADAEL